jgi:hypothetical protein
MISTILEMKILVDGVLTDATSVILEDPTSSFGAKSDDTIIVASGTPMGKVATGIYHYEISTDPGITITWFAKITLDGSTYYSERTKVIASETDSSYYNETLQDAQEIVDDFIINDSPWTGATLGEKEKALKDASRRIDRLNFVGERESAKAFPRKGQTKVPDDIKIAEVHIAIALLNEYDDDLEYDNVSISRTSFAGVSDSRDTKMVKAHIVAGIPSIEAWRLLFPYLRDSESINMMRVS